MMDVQNIVGTLLAVIIGFYLLESFLFSRRNSKEPVYIRPLIPLLGHLVGYLRKGTPYLLDVEAKYPSLGIFSLPIFSFKIYIVANRHVYSAVQRNAKTVSFSPFALKVTKFLSDVSDVTLRSLDTLADDEDARNFARQIHHVHATALSTGPSLDRLNLATAQEMLKFVDDLVTESSRKPIQIDLLEWVRHVVTIAATTGFYGPKNPYKDPQHEKDFWTYHDKLPIFSSGMAWLFARKAIKARDANSRRYEAYMREGGIETASDVIKERTNVFLKNGSPLVDTARMNTGLDTALISNYVLTAFWAIYDLVSRPELLEAIREEVSKTLTKGDGDDDLTLDLSLLRTSCPLLVSSLQETQRLRSAHANIRVVMSDTSLSVGDEQYTLKKGNYVQLHNHVPLHNKAVWGANADDFDPYRFIRMKKDGDGGAVVPPSQLSNISFPVWGAAPHVCPARYHASSGLLVLMALVALRLEVLPAGPEGAVPVRGEGVKWKDVRTLAGFTAVYQPGEPAPVMVRPRGVLEGRWGVTVGTPNTRLLFSVA